MRNSTHCVVWGGLAAAYANAFIEVKAQSEDGLLTARAERIETRWRAGGLAGAERKLHVIVLCERLTGLWLNAPALSHLTGGAGR
jgi:hypothetical protein